MLNKKWRNTIYQYWDGFTVLILDSLLFGFVIFMLFERIHMLMDFAEAHPEYAFSQIINADIKMNPLIYVAFVVVFCLWMVGKGIQHKSELTEKRELTKTLKNINRQLIKLNKRILNGNVKITQKGDGK